jgi:hypothetical protein
MCLLGPHAAFSQDFERRNTVMMFDDHQVYGDPAHYFRQDGDVCSRCVVNNLCTRLDSGYEQFHGRPALVPFASADQVEAMFTTALARFPGAAQYIRDTRQRYRQNQHVAPSAKLMTPSTRSPTDSEPGRRA